MCEGCRAPAQVRHLVFTGEWGVTGGPQAGQELAAVGEARGLDSIPHLCVFLFFCF